LQPAAGQFRLREPVGEREFQAIRHHPPGGFILVVRAVDETAQAGAESAEDPEFDPELPVAGQAIIPLRSLQGGIAPPGAEEEPGGMRATSSGTTQANSPAASFARRKFVNRSTAPGNGG